MSKLAVVQQVCLKIPLRFWAALFVSSSVVVSVGAMAAIAEPIPSTATEGESTPAPSVSATVTSEPVSGMDIVPGVANLQPAELEATADGGDLDQVTSVSQLTDVRPTDWAFQALQSLVERYGCIVGYPDRTYRGNRPLTRYEFAAGVNACLDRISELIDAAKADLVTKEDLLVVQRLQEEFAAELAMLRGKIDGLDVRTTTLERQQFSTTTKLSGLAFVNLTGAWANDNVRYEGIPSGPTPEERFAARGPNGQPIISTAQDPEITMSFLSWLTLNTSFTGKDLLVTQLTSGNGISPANSYASAGLFNTFGTPFTDQTAGTTSGSSDMVIHDLFYSFPVSETFKVTVGPRVNWYRHFDFNRFTFFLTGASSFSSIGSTQTNNIDRGSGAVVEWVPSKQFRLALGYLGENTEFLPSSLFNTSSDPRFGLFGGTYSISAELTFSPSDAINLRFGYNRTRTQALFGQVGGAVGEPIYGFADAGGPGDGGLRAGYGNTFSFNFDWLITQGIGVFGRYSFADVELDRIGLPDRNIGSQSFQIGLGFPDLGKKGALGTISFSMPFDVVAGRRFLVAGGGDGGTQYDLEATYFFPLNENIAIVPAFYVIFNANNFESNPTIFVGNLRTQFSF